MANSHSHETGIESHLPSPRRPGHDDPLCKPKCCPKCGGIECFERPRFFCGQLLTDKDLDAAQRYVIEKNKLHNRYLVGSGVACGLAVRCDPCDECAVVVEPGYAIDCCGNDIVLCEQAPFNVCEYIEKCLREKESGCENKIRPRSRCDDLRKEYCLLLSYAEEPARPITALIRDNGCKNSRCEPSRTKETFRLDLIRRPADQDEKPGGLVGQILHCIETLKELDKLRDEITASANSPEKSWEVYCRFKKKILELYRKGPYVRCALESELCRIEEVASPPVPGVSAAPTTAAPLLRLVVLVLDYLRDCFCDALLVRCGQCEEPTGVILACLTIENKKIVKICNLERTQVITGPALRYWFGFLFDAIGNWFEKFCCELDFDDLLGVKRRRSPIDSPTIGRTVGRPSAAFATMHRFASRAKAKFDPAEFLKFASFLDPEAIHAADYLNRPGGEVITELQKRQLHVELRSETTHEAAYAMHHLADMTWVLPPATTHVEVVTDPEGRVTSIRAK
jgi:hypothetical protein